MLQQKMKSCNKNDIFATENEKLQQE